MKKSGNGYNTTKDNNNYIESLLTLLPNKIENPKDFLRIIENSKEL